MSRRVSASSIRTSCPSRPSRISPCILPVQHQRSHAASAASSDSNTDKLVSTTPDELQMRVDELDTGSEYVAVDERLDDDIIASEFGVKRDENGDIVFAQLDEDGKLTFAPDVAPYDPMFNGKWVEIDGVEVKMPDYDFSQHDWVLRVDSDIGWTTFWSVPLNKQAACRHFEDLTSTDDEYVSEEETYTESGRLALHSEAKRAEALEAQELLAGTPMMAAPGMDVGQPNQVEDPQIVDRERREGVDVWELRAIREKQLAREQWDTYWEVQQQAHMNMLNNPPDEQRDVRYMAKLRAERFDWTEDQIKGIIDSEGRAVSPKVVLNAPTFKTQNPYHLPDYASQGIDYLEDWDDWLESEGRWMDQHNLSEVGGEDSDDEDLSLEALQHATDEDALGPMIEGLFDSGQELTLTDEGGIVWGADDEENE